MNEPKYVTRCRLKTNGQPCEHIITHFPIAVQRRGEAPDQRSQELIGALMKHLSKKHPEALQVIQNDIGFFTGFLTLGMFVTEDPKLKETIIGFGAHLRTITGMPSIPDAAFETELAKIGVTMDDPHRSRLLELLKRTRDHYEGKMTVSERPEPEKQAVTA